MPQQRDRQLLGRDPVGERRPLGPLAGDREAHVAARTQAAATSRTRPRFFCGASRATVRTSSSSSARPRSARSHGAGDRGRAAASGRRRPAAGRGGRRAAAPRRADRCSRTGSGRRPGPPPVAAAGPGRRCGVRPARRCASSPPAAPRPTGRSASPAHPPCSRGRARGRPRARGPGRPACGRPPRAPPDRARPPSPPDRTPGRRDPGPPAAGRCWPRAGRSPRCSR